MLYKKVPRFLIEILLLYAFLFNSCQQPGLNAREDNIAQADTPAQTPQTEQGTPILTTPESPSTRLVMPSTSDSSPDTKQVAVASTRREIIAKRPSAGQPSEETLPMAAKRTKTEVTLPNPIHKSWFTSFTQAVTQIEQDLENEEAWDAMEEVLTEGKKHDFLERSIVSPNDSNPTTEYEYTPLHYAASRGILSLVKELVSCEKVPINIQTQNKKSTPLHLASSRGHLEVVEYLAENGADLNCVDYQENSALHYAAAGNYGEMARDIVHYLVGKGADFKKTTDPNITMLDMAVMVGSIPIVEYWEDNYENDPDPDIDKLTKKALGLAQYRYKNFPKERVVQKMIVRILKKIMRVRQAKKQEGNAG